MERTENTLISFIVIGRNIQKARKQTKMTQDQMAQRLRLSPLHYGRLERGERRASLEQIAQTARILGVSVTSLLDGCMDDEHFEFKPNTDVQELGNAIANLACGCSPKTQQLMYTMCLSLAQSEKNTDAVHHAVNNAS